MGLHPTAAAAGVRLVTHDVLSSTNTEALHLARRGERGPLWVVAARQTAGRGRRGRIWISQPGNLHASLLLTDAGEPRAWPQLSFVAALAVHDAIAQCANVLRGQLAIKWPNDLLLGQRKCAGILIEGESRGPPRVAIGVGVNCTSHPSDTQYPATDLAAAGAPVTAAELVTALSLSMLERLAEWSQGRGFPHIRSEWVARAGGIRENIRVRLARRELSGRFEGLEADGSMVLRLPDGSAATITAGDTLYADTLRIREQIG